MRDAFVVILLAAIFFSLGGCINVSARIDDEGVSVTAAVTWADVAGAVVGVIDPDSDTLADK